ncbi:hypothetical protein FJ692_14315 [Pseudomonas fluorescens]|nr:hypothetical protein FJ692_14315 [Pseudomonas fluorescens]
MPLVTLRVTLWAQSVPDCIPTQSVGTIAERGNDRCTSNNKNPPGARLCRSIRNTCFASCLPQPSTPPTPGKSLNPTCLPTAVAV